MKHLKNFFKLFSYFVFSLPREIEKGKYASTDSFVHCEEIVTKQEFIVVSNHRIIYVTRNDMFGTWSVSIHVF